MSPRDGHTKQALRKKWDEHARTFDEEDSTLAAAVEHQVDWELLQAYLPHNKSARILDAAGGTGRITLPLAKLGYSVALCDISYGMLAVAQQKLRGQGVLDQVEIGQGDACQLPFRDEVFDFSLGWFGMIDAARELIRVTKKGGGISLFLRNSCRAAIDLFPEDQQAALGLLRSASDYFQDDQGESFKKSLRPEEAESLFAAEGVKLLALYASRGLLQELPFPPEALESKSWSEEQFNQLAGMLLRLNQEPSLLGMAKLLVLYGEKR